MEIHKSPGEARMKIKQSVCFPMMLPLPVPLPEFIAEIARIGFDAVEIWKPDETFEELYALTQKHGLRIASFSGHDSLPVGLNDPSQHDRIEAELRQSIDLAAKHGVPGIICFSGNRRPGQSEDEAIEACAEGLRRVAPYAEEKGVNLNLELLNTLVDHAGYQCDHAEWGLAVVKKVNNPQVKLLYDIYHMQIMEGNLIQTIQNNIQWIGHFHTAGVPGRFEIDDTQEINYRGVCKAIAATPYDFYLGHEFHPRRNLFETLREAFEICNQ
jgi:hydroxypyruvate isomerase